jgi:type II secretory pathway component PulJ
MLMPATRDLGDESGITLIELMIALTAGLFVMAALTLAMLMTIRETSRVTSHVEANQRSRLAMTKIVNQLHSACVAPQLAPVQRESTGNTLRFVHQVGSQVAPVPVMTEISLSGETLTQADYQVASGAAPNWTFAATPTSTEELMTGVEPISGAIPLFRYFSYSNGAISSSPLTTPLGANAASAVQVSIAFKAVPRPPVSEDENAATEIQDAVLLRLTPPAYSSATNNLPCQ